MDPISPTVGQVGARVPGETGGSKTLIQRRTQNTTPHGILLRAVSPSAFRLSSPPPRMRRAPLPARLRRRLAGEAARPWPGRCDGEDATWIRSASRVQGPATRTSSPAAECVNSIRAGSRLQTPIVCACRLSLHTPLATAPATEFVRSRTRKKDRELRETGGLTWETKG